MRTTHALVGVLTAVFLLVATPPGLAREDARLLRQPDLGADVVVFSHGGDIWVAPRSGGDARRLTTFAGEETRPQISPDGELVAFTGAYDGNLDVYVVPLAGGEPRRLTWHPGADQVRGWTPDGRVLFASGRINAPRPQPRLWTIGLDEAMPTALPLPRAATGAISPDGARLAYQLVEHWDGEWRGYRGGQAQPIRVVTLDDLALEKLPWDGSNDLDPVWVGETIYFLSDRDWAMNVWSHDTASGELRQRTRFTEFDCKELSAGPDGVVFENGGYLWTLGAGASEPVRLQIAVRGDFPHARPHWAEVGDRATAGRLSPSGVRAVIEARGEVFTVPTDKGDVRNLSRDSGAADRTPSWSPDGRRVAWFSDAGGEYALVIADQHGRERQTISLPEPTFFYSPAWSPDSRWLAYTDADRQVWVLDVEAGRAVRVDTEGSAHPDRLVRPQWSPDSRWLTYSRRLDNQFNGVFVYHVEKQERHQITDGLSDARLPVFDRGGKYLYFLASTDYALNVGWLDMSSYGRPPRHTVYLAVLDADEPSPLAPESDEEALAGADAGDGADEDGEGAAGGEAPAVSIDLAGLDQRIIDLELPARAYASLAAGADGTIFYTVQEDPDRPGGTLHRYSLADREETELIGGVTDVDVSADGKKLLLALRGDRWLVSDAAGKPDPGEDVLDLGGLRMKVDPAAEWAQIFREGWRYQRDYFYVENVHGLDLDWAWETYSPWLEHVRHRSDLNYLLDILGGETAVGHSFTRGGEIPEVETVPVGLLGADVTVQDGRYRLERIYDGENWNPELAAPLSGPGIDVREGDLVLAVDGRAVTADRNFYSYFDQLAGRQVVLEVADDPSGDDAREVTVIPVRSEEGLRRRAWVEDNRRRVDELSGGRLAYVWIPDTGRGGYTSFNRYFFAQMHKQGAVIDERFNQGGSIADYIVDLLDRPLYGYFNNPVGEKTPWTAPNAALFGPKVMLVNEMSGSGGDMLPYMFRARELGPLIGTRTWGGLVGIWDVPPFIDGGFMTAPRGGFYTTAGEWAVENEGVAPDIPVEMTPRLVAAGRDPQLERAVQEALARLADEAVQHVPQPADPVRSRRP